MNKSRSGLDFATTAQAYRASAQARLERPLFDERVSMG
jgi:hypothetical protein